MRREIQIALEELAHLRDGDSIVPYWNGTQYKNYKETSFLSKLVF